MFALRQELTGSVALVALTLWLRGAVPNQERPMTRVPPIAGSSPSQNGLLCVPQCMNAAEPPAAPNGGYLKTSLSTPCLTRTSAA